MILPNSGAIDNIPIALAISELLLALAATGEVFVGSGPVNGAHTVLSTATSSDLAIASAFRYSRMDRGTQLISWQSTHNLLII
jgi:hypothetical protein